MNKLLILVIVALAIFGANLFLHTKPQQKFLSESNFIAKYYEWKEKYQRNYNAEEDIYRIAIYISNYELIQSENAR